MWVQVVGFIGAYLLQWYLFAIYVIFATWAVTLLVCGRCWYFWFPFTHFLAQITIYPWGPFTSHPQQWRKSDFANLDVFAEYMDAGEDIPETRSEAGSNKKKKKGKWK